MASVLDELNQAVDELAKDPFVPEAECDIVMKGGITSGVIYPLAVVELATKYRFRSVGGASAGAIAAAAAAAAEFGRDRDGFVKLARLPGWLGQNLTSLFQPAKETEPLFRMMLAATAPKGPGHRLRLVGQVLASSAIAATAGFAGSALVAGGVLRLLGTPWPPTVIVALVAALLGTVVALGVRCHKLLTVDVPGNFYGICTGYAEPPAGPASNGDAPKPLTTWLEETLEYFAGIDRVLTFGDLWGPDAVAADIAMGPEPTIREVSAQRRLRHINLEMMTTSLAEGRPRRLPFDDRVFYFCPADMARMFPPAVVEQLVRAGTAERDSRRAGERDWTCPTDAAHGALLPMPPARDLPVVVAARMSLSFPVFISAVRLYAVDYVRTDQPVVACWFSDGGIGSNFPVHFFDSMLPSRPTFGLSLAPYPDLGPGRVPDDVYLPSNANEGLRATLRPVPSLPKFAGEIADTMQNWRDNTQAVLPGFRDRIAVVHHRDDEGGMNLQMPVETIAALALRGRAAARLINSTFDFQAHRWTRFRSSLSLLDQLMAKLSRDYDALPAGYKTFLDTYVEPACYKPPSAKWRTYALGAFGDLMTIARQWEAENLRCTEDAPSPNPVLRITPYV